MLRLSCNGSLLPLGWTPNTTEKIYQKPNREEDKFKLILNKLKDFTCRLYKSSTLNS